MKEDTARAVLRLIGVITILVGAVLTTTALVGTVGVQSAIRSATQGMRIEATGLGAMGFYAVLAYVLVAGWGVGLYLSAASLARHVVE